MFLKVVLQTKFVPTYYLLDGLLSDMNNIPDMKPFMDNTSDIYEEIPTQEELAYDE